MVQADVVILPLFPDYPPHALHFQDGFWTADCASCGYTVAASKHQDRVELEARRTPCPVCHPSAA
jgi:hypothetical protein